MDSYVIQDFFFMLKEKKQLHFLLLLVLLTLLSITGWAMYHSMTIRKAGQAQKAFSQAHKEFEKTKQLGVSERNWREVADMFEKGYELYKNTSWAPYFLSYKGQALLLGQDFDAARKTAEHVLEGIKKPSPAYYLYAIEYALMQRDSQDPQAQIAGQRALDGLSNDQQNPIRDQALYYAGYTALKSGDDEKAQQIWSHLIARFAQKKSPWVEAAQQQMAALLKRAQAA